MLNKHILNHSQFYIAHYIKNPKAPTWIFIHGGPGYNCGTVEYLMDHAQFFDELEDNLILYDQRRCGRSLNFPSQVAHIDNVQDLEVIYQYLTKKCGLTIKGFIGHSYGAKLLFDYYQKHDSKLPGVFVSTASSILTPRLNNLKFDLIYLKKTYPASYDEILQQIVDLDFEKLWLLTEKMAPLFLENIERIFLYWANLDRMQECQIINQKINLPINQKTFMSVRKDLYSNEKNFSISITQLKIPYLWINGFHDMIVNEPDNFIFSQASPIKLFYQSAHYPHIEENKLFCQMINQLNKRNSYEE